MKWIAISPKEIKVCGELLKMKSSGIAMLTEAYRQYINDYPKFFKMDGLCKLGFIASELLLQQENATRFVARDDRSVILFNHSGSIDADKNYQMTISADKDYFPSPAMFVYTLPNIITGEIAIRNKYYGETSFYVLDSFSAEMIINVCVLTQCDNATKSVLAGWLDYADEQHFCGIIFLSDCVKKENAQLMIDQINKIYNDLK